MTEPHTSPPRTEGMDTASLFGDRRPLHYFFVVAISLVFFIAGVIIIETLSWSNPMSGFVNGVFHAVFFAIGWVIFIVPWLVVVYVVYSAGRYRRFRTAWALAPAVLLFVFEIGALVVYPPTAANRFVGTTGVELPESAPRIQTHFTGGGIADYSDTYYFTCTPDDTERLIDVLNLTPDNDITGQWLETAIPLHPGWPDYRKWPGTVLYAGAPDGTWFYYLLTDRARSRVYIFVGCI